MAKVPVFPPAAKLRSLLVPVDLTPSSDRVLARLALLPLAEDATVTLLHVVPGALPAREQRRAELDAEKALAEEARQLEAQRKDKATFDWMVKVGSAAKEIATVAAERNVELVVMGRSSGRALRDALLGSTAERVVRQALRPVLVVRLRARTGYRRPLLAIDLDDCAEQVVRHMLLVLPRERPPVDVVHAFDIPYRGMIYPSLSDAEAQDRKEELAANATNALIDLLARAVERAGVPADEVPSWRTQVRYGSARLVVEKALGNAESDLLVVGTHGYSGAAYAFLGTVAGDLLRAAACDVLVVPPAPRS